METRSKLSGGSESLKKAIGAAKRQSSPDIKNSQIFLHASHRETNTKLGLHSSNAKKPLVIVHRFSGLATS